VRLKRGGWKVDAFAMRPVLPDFDWFDDTSDERRKVCAIYHRRALLRHKTHEMSHHCLGDRPSKE
jgi:hypothetical protein